MSNEDVTKSQSSISYMFNLSTFEHSTYLIPHLPRILRMTCVLEIATNRYLEHDFELGLACICLCLSYTTPMDADRGIPRSPSAPHFVSGDGTAGTVYPRFPAHICCVPSHNHSHPQPVYVLAADGSQLYLLDTSKRPGNEEPPPYLPIRQDSALPLRTELAPPHTRIRAATVSGALRRSTSSGSVPISSIGVPCPARSGPASPLRLDETTPLLGHPTEVAATAPPQWRWREILCGWDDSSPGVRGYFAPMSDKSNWKAVGHLIAINLPLVRSPTPCRLTTEPTRVATTACRYFSGYGPADHTSDRRGRMVAHPDPRAMGGTYRAKTAEQVSRGTVRPTTADL